MGCVVYTWINKNLKATKVIYKYSKCGYLVCYDNFRYTQQKSFAQVGVWVNSALTRNGCIKCYISLFTEIIVQQLDTFRTEIQGSLRKLCTFKASRGHPQKW